MKCETCGAEMKHIPAGVSKKTGKAYQEFYSCPDCKTTFNPHSKEAQLRPNAERKFEASLDNGLAYEKDAKISRLAIIKSLIEKGHSPNNEINELVEKWEKIANGKWEKIESPEVEF